MLEIFADLMNQKKMCFVIVCLCESESIRFKCKFSMFLLLVKDGSVRVCEYSNIITTKDLYPKERARRKTHDEMTHKTIKQQQRKTEIHTIKKCYVIKMSKKSKHSNTGLNVF